MRQKMKQLLGILLSLVMVLGLVPGMSLTAYAATDTYTGLMNNKTVVKFNNHDWYIIADNSTAVDAGTVTLLAADNSFGTSKFDGEEPYSNAYSNSTVKGVLDALTAEGGAFAGVKDAIVDTNLTDITPNVTGAKLYLLSTSEADPYKNLAFNGASYGGWWLRSPGGDDYFDYAAFVYGNYGGVYGGPVEAEFGVRPALKLNLSSVIFSSNTFTVGSATVDVTGVSLDKTTAQTIEVNGTVSFTATVSPDNATDKKVKWSVGGTDTDAVKLYSDAACNTEVGTAATSTLTVYAKGISAGSATVTCTSNADSTKSASCNVTVNAAAVSYPLWVGGVQVTSSKLSDNGWSFSSDSNTLTLTNYSYTGDGGTKYSGIYYNGSSDLTVSLTGNNAITINNDSGHDSYGIYFYANNNNLKIVGDGNP